MRYFIQRATTLLRQHPLFSVVYILGTALSVALVMVLFIIFYVKWAPVYPEGNRQRTVVLQYVQCESLDGSGFMSAQVSRYAADHLLKNLPHLEAMALTSRPFSNNSQRVNATVQDAPQRVAPLYVNDGFWKVFTFRFLSGKGFSEAEVEASQPVAVLSATLARQLFATDDAVGKEFFLNGSAFRVGGVVEDVSWATPATAADLWLPLSFDPYAWPYQKELEILRGNLMVYMTAPTAGEKEALKAEVREAFRRYNTQCRSFRNLIYDQPDDYWKSGFRVSSTLPLSESLRPFVIFLLALLFIPSLNLSGIIASRMGGRIEELGIRKVYGASNATLFRQVLHENFLFTALGSLLGIILCWILLTCFADWLFSVIELGEVSDNEHPIVLTAQMLFHPVVFLAALVYCWVLNVLSAWLPALWLLRKSIVDQLHRRA